MGWYAEVIVRHDVLTAKIIVRIYDKQKKIIKEECVIETKPNEFAYAKYLNLFRWEEDDVVVLESKNGEIFRIEL